MVPPCPMVVLFLWFLLLQAVAENQPLVQYTLNRCHTMSDLFQVKQEQEQANHSGHNATTRSDISSLFECNSIQGLRVQQPAAAISPLNLGHNALIKQALRQDDWSVTLWIIPPSANSSTFLFQPILSLSTTTVSEQSSFCGDYLFQIGLQHNQLVLRLYQEEEATSVGSCRVYLAGHLNSRSSTLVTLSFVRNQMLSVWVNDTIRLQARPPSYTDYWSSSLVESSTLLLFSTTTQDDTPFRGWIQQVSFWQPALRGIGSLLGEGIAPATELLKAVDRPPMLVSSNNTRLWFNSTHASTAFYPLAIQYKMPQLGSIHSRDSVEQQSHTHDWITVPIPHDESGVWVDYYQSNSDSAYFNAPLHTPRGDVVVHDRNATSILFRVAALRDSVVSEPVVQELYVRHVNHPPQWRRRANATVSLCTLGVDRSIDQLPFCDLEETKEYLCLDDTIDRDVDWIRLDLRSIGGQVRLVDDLSPVRLLNSILNQNDWCSRRDGTWQCVGGSSTNRPSQRWTMVLLPSEVATVLNSLRYESFDPTVKQQGIRVIVYDGMDGDCLSHQEHNIMRNETVLPTTLHHGCFKVENTIWIQPMKKYTPPGQRNEKQLFGFIPNSDLANMSIVDLLFWTIVLFVFTCICATCCCCSRSCRARGAPIAINDDDDDDIEEQQNEEEQQQEPNSANTSNDNRIVVDTSYFARILLDTVAGGDTDDESYSDDDNEA